MRSIQLTEDQLKILIESVDRDVHPKSGKRRHRTRKEILELEEILIHLQTSLNALFIVK